MRIVVALIAGMALPGIALAAGAPPAPMLAQAQAKPATPAAPPAPATRDEPNIFTARGVVETVDKEKETVVLKARRRSLVLNVRDPRLFDVIKVGTPVVVKFYQSLAIDLKTPGEASPGVTARQGVATSKPGAPPVATVGRQVTVTTPIVAINAQNQTVTVKGPEGYPETARVKDANLLGKFKVGDTAQITYTQRLAISFEKPTDSPAEKKQPR